MEPSHGQMKTNCGASLEASPTTPGLRQPRLCYLEISCAIVDHSRDPSSQRLGALGVVIQTRAIGTSLILRYAVTVSVNVRGHSSSQEDQMFWLGRLCLLFLP